MVQSWLYIRITWGAIKISPHIGHGKFRISVDRIKERLPFKGTKVENHRTRLLPVLSLWISKSLKMVNYKDIFGFKLFTQETLTERKGMAKSKAKGSNKEFQTLLNILCLY